MKKSLTLFLLSLLFVRAEAQCDHSCTMSSCDMSSSSSSPSATAAFASLGSDINFQNAHKSPLPLNYVAMGRMITFPTPDGKTGSAYYVPAKKQTKNYLFVFHEYWGLNDWIRKEADMFADSLPNTNVIALDLYDGKSATASDEAVKIMQSMDQTRAQNIIKGAVNYAGKDAKIATIGWCFGGGWSMQGALIAGNQLSGCVMFYGMPETDVNKLKTLSSDVLFIWANKDQWINQKVKDDFITNMKSAEKKLTVKEYSADHAFANPSNPHYDKQSGDDATKNALAYLRAHLM
ncbi:MAG: dienelactone hydrolase family protein [Chitinophagales bacterium]